MKPITKLIVVLMVCSMAAPAQATDLFWNAPAGGFFNVPANWTPIGTPGVGDNARFNLNNNFTVDFNASQFSDNLSIGAGNVSFSPINSTVYTVGTASIIDDGNLTVAGNSNASLQVNLATTTVGRNGSGSLFIRSGGSLWSEFSIIGELPGSTGGVVVDGLNALWQVDRFVQIGSRGNGSLQIINGGRVNNRVGLIGANSPSNGTVTVAGANSTWTNTVAMAIDLGTLNIRTGAIVTAPDTQITSSGVLNLQGGTLATSVLTIDQQSAENGPGSRFNWLSGTLRMNGAAGFNTNHPIFDGLLMLGPNQTLDVTNTLTIGPDGPVLLTGGQVAANVVNLEDGSIFGPAAFDLDNILTLNARGVIGSSVVGTQSNSIINATGNLVLGSLDQSNGFDFSGRLDLAGQSVFLLDADVADLGTLTLLGEGGRLTTVHGARLEPTDHLEGGGIVDGPFTNDGLVVGPADTSQFLTFVDDVNGSGSFQNSVAFSNAYRPSNRTDVIELQNAMFDSSSTLNLEIGGLALGEYDRLEISGDATILGTLLLELESGFTLAEGDEFEIIDLAGTLTGQFAGLDEGAQIDLGTGLPLQISYFGGDGNDVVLTAIPEPNAIVLVLATVVGSGVLLPRARRRDTGRSRRLGWAKWGSSPRRLCTTRSVVPSKLVQDWKSHSTVLRVVTVGMVWLLSTIAYAQATFNFTDAGGGFGDFVDAANWTPVGGPPDPVDTALFNRAASYNVRFVFQLPPITNDTLRVTAGEPTFHSRRSDFRSQYLLTGGVEVEGGSLVLGDDGIPVSPVDVRGVIDVELQGFGGIEVGANGTGSLTVTNDSTLVANDSRLLLGFSGDGTLAIDDGGTVTNRFAEAAFNAGSVANVTVDGSGSRWTNSENLFLASRGNATMRILNGGSVSSQRAFLAFDGGGNADVTVESGATWTMTELFAAGNSLGPEGESATVHVNPGGNVIVTGGSRLYPGAQINLQGGNYSTGTLEDLGGRLTWTSGRLAVTGPAGLNTTHPLLGRIVTLDPGRTLDVLHTLTVDPLSPVSIIGGSLRAGAINLDSASIVGNGTLDMNGIGSLTGSGQVTTSVVGTLTGRSITATGNLIMGDLRQTGAYRFAGTLNMPNQSVVLLDAGTAELGVLTSLGQTGRLTTVNGASIGPGEVLQGGGLVDGDFTNNGQVDGPTGAGEFLSFADDVDGSGAFTGNIRFLDAFSPGNSPGVVEFENFSLSSTSEFLLELGGLFEGEFDLLKISGDANLGGELAVSLLSDFVPSVGDEFEILNVGGILSGQFRGLEEGEILTDDTGQPFQISYLGGDGNDVVLTAGLAGDFNFDGDIDGADFLLWQRGGSPNSLSADDLAAWQTNFGAGMSLPSIHPTTVPEPAPFVFLLIGALIGLIIGNRMRSQTTNRK